LQRQSVHPGRGNSVGHNAIADIDLTLNSMAALRLMRPDWIIPAVSALNLAEPGWRLSPRTAHRRESRDDQPHAVRYPGDYLLYKTRPLHHDRRTAFCPRSRRKNLFPSKQSLADFYRQKIDARRPTKKLPWKLPAV